MELIMANEGNAHINVKRVELAGHGDEETIFKSEDGGYVLAGEGKRWPLNVTPDALKGLIVVRADSSIGPIETVLTLQDN
jgi:hypothetical protein